MHMAIIGIYNELMQDSDPQVNSGTDDDLVNAVLRSSRALVAVAARSLGAVDEDVTLAQYRVLVELAARGPQSVADLASILGVGPSTATRMCDRLVRKGLVSRRRSSVDRRLVKVSLARPGSELVDQVTFRRREELALILSRMPADHKPQVLRALKAFSAAAGEVPEQEWSLGWRVEGPLGEAAR